MDHTRSACRHRPLDCQLVALKLYVTNFSDDTATYGAIGAVIVTMLWSYVGSVAVLIGAEINAVIEAMQAAARRPLPVR